MDLTATQHASAFHLTASHLTASSSIITTLLKDQGSAKVFKYALEETKETQLSQEVLTTPPSSPRGSKSSQKKRTPPRMKNHCIRMSPSPTSPSAEPPVSSKRLYKIWLNEHQEEVKGPLEEVIDKVIFFSEKQFNYQLEKSVDWVNSQLAELYRDDCNPQKQCIVLAEPGKSNLWVAQLAKEHFGFEAERYMDLGPKNANAFTAMLDTVSAEQVQMEILKDKFRNKTIVLFDDASYSGNQMSSHLTAVTQAIKTYKLEVKKVLVVVPFATHYALERLREIPKAEIYPAFNILTISDLNKDTRSMIARLWYNGNTILADRIGLAIFDHKVPNYQSFPTALVKGSVFLLNAEGKSESKEESYLFLTERCPAYKGESAERFPLGDVTNRRL